MRSVAWCAWTLKRPVKWCARAQRGVPVRQRMAATCAADAELALDADGTDAGAPRAHRWPTSAPTRRRAGVVIQLLIGPWVQTSVYDIADDRLPLQGRADQHDADGRLPRRRPARGDLHHRAADGRGGARRPASTRVELRRRNMIRPEQMPYKNADGPDLRQRQRSRRSWTRRWRWPTGAASTRARAESKQARPAARPGHRHLPRMDRRQRASRRRSRSTVRPTASIEIFSRDAGDGPGHRDQLLAQLAVDVFGVPIEKVRIVQGDTDRGTGFGSAGSRSLFIGGSARAGGVGADAWTRRSDWPPQALEAAGRRHRICREGVSASRAPTGASACSSWPAKQPRAAHPASNAPARCRARAGPTPATSARWKSIPTPARSRWSATPSVNDVGRVVNPMIVVGQLDGGAVQGIGQALCEHMVYDRDQRPAADRQPDGLRACRASDIVDATFTTELDQSDRRA